jgi:hypothetical protein
MRSSGYQAFECGFDFLNSMNEVFNAETFSLKDIVETSPFLEDLSYNKLIFYQIRVKEQLILHP